MRRACFAGSAAALVRVWLPAATLVAIDLAERARNTVVRKGEPIEALPGSALRTLDMMRRSLPEARPLALAS